MCQAADRPILTQRTELALREHTMTSAQEPGSGFLARLLGSLRSDVQGTRPAEPTKEQVDRYMKSTRFYSQMIDGPGPLNQINSSGL
jgi:hypothetical protein